MPRASQRGARQRILDAMPGNMQELMARANCSQTSAQNWLVDLTETKQAHISAYQRTPQGGRPAAVYSAGPRVGPAVRKPKVLDDAQRMRRLRASRARSAEAVAAESEKQEAAQLRAEARRKALEIQPRRPTDALSLAFFPIQQEAHG